MRQLTSLDAQFLAGAVRRWLLEHDELPDEPPGRRRPSLASVTDLTPRRDLLGKVQ